MREWRHQTFLLNDPSLKTSRLRKYNLLTQCYCLQELSASLDTYVPKSADLFRAPSATSQDHLIENGESLEMFTSILSLLSALFCLDYNAKNEELNLKGIYNARQELGGNFRSGTLQTFGGGGGVGPNGLSKKQELMVRSAIKYWVERHKHVVR